MLRPPMGESQEVALQQVLAYLNLSAGQPDPRFQENLNTVFHMVAEELVLPAPNTRPKPLWKRVHERLSEALETYRGQSAALGSTEQIEAVLTLVFDRLLPDYLQHHRDLLFHQNDSDLFNSFFVARACEIILAQSALASDGPRSVRKALAQFNDFIGHRPVPVLHNDRKTEPYQHERVRPVPIYLRGAGFACGKYRQVAAEAWELLTTTDPELLAEACFDPELVDELAIDPRAYDFGHPVNRRPNYQFGEWDPHVIDNRGHYRRFVIRQVTLDALLDRAAHPGDIPPDEARREAAAVLAGVILMAAGISGSGPETHDSSVTLAGLVTRIAAYRDRFYQQLIERLPAAHSARLKAEAERAKQPLGGARQHLNRYLARLRAAQLQHIELSKLFAEMGYPEASQRQAQIIPVARGRMLSEICSRITTCHYLLNDGKLPQAAALAPEMEDLLHRAIECGAFVDPWNILGFQGQFSIFASLENSVHDQRVDELTDLIEDLFTLHIRLASESAATGQTQLQQTIVDQLGELARWWDQFATGDVSGVRNVSGRESLESAQHVSAALGAWHQAGAAAGDVAFWRNHVSQFASPKSYTLVIEALLEKRDLVASLALLVQWLSQASSVPLQEGRFSFHTLAVRWMQACTQSGTPALVRKFFDYLEANADEFWEVPRLEHRLGRRRNDATAPDADDFELEEDDEASDPENPFGAAYENMVYRDSTADGHEGETLSGDEAKLTDDELLAESEHISFRLRFLTTLATLWRTAGSRTWDKQADDPTQREQRDILLGWFARAQANQQSLMDLLESLHRRPLPQPPATPASMVEYDRVRRMRDALAGEMLLAYVATGRAALGLLAAIPEAAAPESASNKLPEWQRLVVELQRRILAGQPDRVRQLLPATLASLTQQPLLYVPLAKRGDPRQVAAAQILQQVLRDLLRALPRLGLLRETYHLIETARVMEKQVPVGPRAVSEFDRLFQIGFQAIVEHLVLSSEAWHGHPADEHGGDDSADAELIEGLQAVTDSLSKQWRAHSQSLRLSVVEKIGDEASWKRLIEFIRTYGGELFGPRFLNQGNLRSILHQGVDTYLTSLAESNEAEGLKLMTDLDGPLPRNEAVAALELILEAIVENYAEYKDFNSTTTQSDSGENLFMLLDFLRLKASYERLAWNLRPVVLAHEVLVRKGRDAVAERWRRVLEEYTSQAANWHLKRLELLQKTYAIQLPTVADRVREQLIRPLALDRIRALVRPAVDEARLAASPAFRRLEQELVEFAEQPTGVGLDVPAWLVALEEEVQQARAPVQVDSLATDWLPQVPTLLLTRDELAAQLEKWEEPLTEEE